jgi:hypothetical protein
MRCGVRSKTEIFQIFPTPSFAGTYTKIPLAAGRFFRTFSAGCSNYGGAYVSNSLFNGNH